MRERLQRKRRRLEEESVDSGIGGSGGAGGALVIGGATGFTLTFTSSGRSWRWPIGARSPWLWPLFTSCYVIRSARWALLLRHIQKVGPFSLLGTQVIGFTGVALLGRIADPVRPYLVAKKTGFR